MAHAQMELYFVILWTFSVFFVHNAIGEVTSPEADGIRRLYNVSFYNYNKNMRPLLNQSHAIQVMVQFYPTTLLSLDTTDQTLEIIGKFTLVWTDEFLAWNPGDYFGTDTFQVSAEQMWHPNLEFFPTSNGHSKIGNEKNDLFVVRSDGKVRWRPLQFMSTVCDVSVRYYPFDEQTCIIYLNDADFDNRQVTYNFSSTFAMEEHPEWEPLTMTTEKNVYFGTDLIKITFKLRRRHSLTMYSLVAPLITMALLNVFLFLLPVTSGEKCSVAITLFLAYGVLMVVTRDMMPDNSLEISILVEYVFVLLVLSVFTVIYCIIEARLQSSYGSRLVRLPRLAKPVMKTTDFQMNQHDEEKNSVDTGEETQEMESKTSITVGEILLWLDTIIFCLGFIGGVLYSYVVFHALSSQ